MAVVRLSGVVLDIKERDFTKNNGERGKSLTVQLLTSEGQQTFTADPLVFPREVKVSDYLDAAIEVRVYQNNNSASMRFFALWDDSKLANLLEALTLRS